MHSICISDERSEADCPNFTLFQKRSSNDYSKGLGRSIVHPNHVLGALEELEFKDFSEKLSRVMEERLLNKKPTKKDKKTEDDDGEDQDRQKDEELEVDG